jgi:hypothetical protein
MTRHLFVVALIAVAGCSGNMRSEPPKQTDEIIFSHDFHQKLEFDCDTCHKGITENNDLAKASFLPKEETCLECHADQKESGECGFCHTDAKNPQTYARRAAVAAVVPHAKHAAAKVECAKCHTTLPEPSKPVSTPADHPTCLSCHEHEKAYAQGSCEGCHKDLTRFAVRPVATFSHEGDFLRTHGQQASTSAATCAKCHDQTMCADCHAKTVATRIELKFPEDVTSRFIHRGDYVSRHMLDARADNDSCAKCHGTTFCSSCHTANNLTASAQDPRSPHPPGWGFPGAREFHGPAARNDIVSCASCHDQGARSNCVTCHAVGGPGGNPHPTSWLSRHDASEIAENGMCRTCH